MGTILASAIQAKAAIDLFDESADRFSNSDYLSWINEGQRQATKFKPDVNVTTSAVQLVAGTKQSLSAGEIALINITRNMGTDGATPGNAIFFNPSMDQFAKRHPTWNTDTESATVQLYFYNPKNPKIFYVYPKQPAASQGYVEIARSVLPTNVSAIGNAINIGDEYEMELYHYCMYKGNLEDAKHSQIAMQEAVSHYKQFLFLLERLDLIEKFAIEDIMKKGA